MTIDLFSLSYPTATTITLGLGQMAAWRTRYLKTSPKRLTKLFNGSSLHCVTHFPDYYSTRWLCQLNTRTHCISLSLSPTHNGPHKLSMTLHLLVSSRPFHGGPRAPRCDRRPPRAATRCMDGRGKARWKLPMPKWARMRRRQSEDGGTQSSLTRNY